MAELTTYDKFNAGKYDIYFNDPQVKEVRIQGQYEEVVLYGSRDDNVKRSRYENSGIKDGYKKKTLKDYRPITETQREAIQIAREYATSYIDGKVPRDKQNGLYIQGQIGTGKTYLASILANTIIERGFDVLMQTSIELSENIRKHEYHSTELSNRFKDKCKSYDLVIIDDIGKDKSTEWNVSQIFDIVDTRVANNLPTIFTSNHSLQDLKDRLTPKDGDDIIAESIVDRINQMCKLIKIEGESVR